ncbi:MAG: histidine kinase [Bacteroidetes bacterium]|nr:histidine kinase [Bacteroidota bacterium]
MWLQKNISASLGRGNVLFLSLVCCVFFSKAQNTQIVHFGTQDGLSSNSIYQTILDKKGFLWIAGENGITRYDGRTFKNYTTLNGLPDNEITKLFIDSNGRIWAIPFRKKPAYYNESIDAFENNDTDPELNKINLTSDLASSVLSNGGVAFIDYDRTVYIYKNKRMQVYPFVFSKYALTKPDQIIDFPNDTYLIVCFDSLRYFRNGQVEKSIAFDTKYNWSEYFNRTLYLAQSQKIITYQFNESGEIIASKSQNYPFEIRVMCQSGNNLYIVSTSGNTYWVDIETLKLKENIMSDEIVRNIMKDYNGDYWLSTKDDGLIKIQKKRISSFTENKEFVKSFNTVLKISNGKILAGNNKGALYVYDGLYSLKKITLSKPEISGDTWIRNIIELPQEIYIATQTESFILNKQTYAIKKSFSGSENKSTKVAYKLNDDTLLLGNHNYLYIYNVRSGKRTDSVRKRITAIGANNSQQIYIGSTDGLYRKDEDSLFYFGKNDKRFTYRIVSIINTHDNLMWIARSSDSVFVLSADKIAGAIPLGTDVPGTVCKVMYSSKPGEIWIGTDKGLNKIRYRFDNNHLTYLNTFFSKTDGLIGEQVNDIMIKNDTTYVATSGGISYLPENMSLPVVDIPTFITRVSFNNKDTAILSSYTLPYYIKDIGIAFSAIDLTGFNPQFEYNINHKGWQRIDNNFLSLQNQPSGVYSIQIRSIKRDGQPSSQTAEISFIIKTPFWKRPLFYAIALLTMLAAIIFFFARRNKIRQQKAIDKLKTENKIAELEMQALKAQINPHFVFNCLNSIKGFVYDKDYMQADKYLDKFSELLRSTMDNAEASVISINDEIRYLDTYLNLEQLRFADKFDYQIIVDEQINQSKTFVPAMLLQPYVENAIRHGIRYLENKMGHIIISMKQKDDFVICEIDDNGIGRAQASALKSKQHIEYQSKGMQLSERRAALYHIEQSIIDKQDKNGNATGTTIILKIPTTLQS